MINVSGEYRRLIYNDDRNFIVTVKMRLADGTKLTIQNNRIMENGIIFDDAVGEDSTFSAIGSAIINSFTLVLNNIYEDFSDYDFTDAVITSIKLALILSDGTVETLNKAIATNEDTEEVYTVDDTSYNGATITLTCLDNMSKFDKPYSTSNLNYPARLDNIIINACQQCGVTLAASSTTFPKYDFIVANKPSQETTSFREVISWCATIAGCFARCNTQGELELKWFDTQSFEKQPADLDGGVFDNTNPITENKIIDAQVLNHGVTVTYESNGWWHITGERDTDSQFTVWLYNDILAEYGNSVIISSVIDGSAPAQTSVYAQYSTAEGQIASNHSIQLNKSQTATVYNLTKVGLIFNRRSGTEPLPKFDARIKFIVGYVKSYESGDTADGGLFNPWETGTAYSGGDFNSFSILNISNLYSQDIGTDDVVITKVSANIKSDDAPVDSEVISVDGIVSYSKGTDGYEIQIENNEFITALNIKTIVDYLGDQLIGLRFRRVNITHLSDPTIEAGDIAYVWDRKNNRYQILITRTAFSISSSQTTVCGASTPLRNSAKRFSEATKSYVELRKRIQSVQNPYAKALSDLASAMQQANGLYTTEITQPDGSVITYKHNMPNLSESNIQMAITTVGATFTTNGTDNDPTWYGFTMDGRVIASILNAAGIIANWIRSGQLIVEDGQGNETFFADYATGIVRINATQFKVAVGNDSKTIQQITDEAINSLNVGARNLLKESTIVTRNSTLSGITVVYEGDGWWHVFGTTAGTYGDYIILYQDINALINEPGTYTLSAEMTDNPVDVNGGVVSYFVKISDEMGATMEISEEPYYSKTFTLESGQSIQNIQYAIKGTGIALDGRFRIKIEKGSKASDWSPAFEDLGTNILYGTPDIMIPENGYAVSGGTYLIDEITEQTYRWDSVANSWILVSDYLDSIKTATDTIRTELNQAKDSLEISITQTNENLEEIKTHYRFDENGETIGKTGSPKSIKLSNDGIGMQVNGETVTKWNQDEMYTPTKVRVPVGGSLQLGDFIFQPRSSGNISLLFVGGD